MSLNDNNKETLVTKYLFPSIGNDRVNISLSNQESSNRPKKEKFLVIRNLLVTELLIDSKKHFNIKNH